MFVLHVANTMPADDYIWEPGARPTNQSGTKPNLVAKIMATNFGNRWCIGYQNW